MDSSNCRWARAALYFVCSLIFLVSTGCGTLDNRLYNGYAVDPLDKSAVAPYNSLVTSLTSPVDGKTLLATECFGQPISNLVKTCRSQRDQAISALVIGSEQLCMQHRKSIYGREASWNITMSTLTSLFAGSAAVISSEQGKSVLSALALFTNSERSLVNETVYKQMLVTAVDKKIVQVRETRQTAIYESLKKPIAEYGMHAALRDVIAYHQSCSFMTGLQLALEEGTQGANAQKIMRLRTSIAGVTSQMNAMNGQDLTKAPAKDEYEQLKARLAALTEALKTVETQ